MIIVENLGTRKRRKFSPPEKSTFSIAVDFLPVFFFWAPHILCVCKVWRPGVSGPLFRGVEALGLLWELGEH